MTVQEWFNEEGLSLGMVEEKGEESSYWATAFTFVNGIYHDDVAKLSTKQSNWLSRIVDDLVEWRIKNRKSMSDFHDARV